MAKIIFADDTESMFKLLSYKLQKEGFEIIGFNSGVGVVEAVLEHRPELVILDIMMPVKDGFAVLKEIKANPEITFTPVILLTANAHVGDYNKGIELGANAYITKPFSYPDLLARIKKILRLS